MNLWVIDARGKRLFRASHPVPRGSQYGKSRLNVPCRLAPMFAAGLLLSGCHEIKPAVSMPIPARDLAAASSKIQGATILDIGRFEPTVPIGMRCRIRPLKIAVSAPSVALATALEQARSYSLEQKGVSLLVMRNGEVIHRSFAMGVNETTPTDSFSMHKSVLALVFGKALQEGLIKSLDDPVGDYIDEWRNDPRGAITLRQFLTMSSGLNLTTSQTESLELLLSSDIDAVALRKPLADPPGTVFGYSNANSQIAGIALERVIKRAGYFGYAEYLEKKIWCPIGNNSGALWLDRIGGSPHYYSGLFTNIENWARIGELIRNQGRAGGKQVIPAQWIAQMGQPSALNSSYGIHIWLGSPWVAKRRYNQKNPITVVHSAPYLADDVLFFDGFGGQRVYIVPSAGLTIVRTGQVNFDYDDARIVNLVLAAMQ